MRQIAKRIERLEPLYFSDRGRVGFYLPEIQFLCDFPKQFPDFNAAPPRALAIYRQLKERWIRAEERRRKRNDSPTNSMDNE